MTKSELYYLLNDVFDEYLPKTGSRTRKDFFTTLSAELEERGVEIDDDIDESDIAEEKL